MLPVSLLPEDVVRMDGAGPAVDVNRVAGKLLVLTLGITRAIEQTSLSISIWGSTDGANWGSRPLATIPQKSYCGHYSTLLNLAANPDVRYLRAEWKLYRLSKFIGTPLFGFSLDAEESGARIHAAVA
jgi:hypothetical protein